MLNLKKKPSKTHWMEIAMGEIGVAEISGNVDNSRIVEYHQSTTLRASDDETPWCASFANWVLKQARIEGTDSAAALSFKKWGEPVKPNELTYGDICVMDHGGGRGHVGFYVGKDRSGRILLLGGNQDNEVNTTAYDAEKFDYFRRPRKLSDTKTAKIAVGGAAAAVVLPTVINSVNNEQAKMSVETAKQILEQSGNLADVSGAVPQYTDSVVNIVEAVAPGFGELARVLIVAFTAGALLWNRARDLKSRGM